MCYRSPRPAGDAGPASQRRIPSIQSFVSLASSIKAKSSVSALLFEEPRAVICGRTANSSHELHKFQVCNMPCAEISRTVSCVITIFFLFFCTIFSLDACDDGSPDPSDVWPKHQSDGSGKSSSHALLKTDG